MPLMFKHPKAWRCNNVEKVTELQAASIALHDMILYELHTSPHGIEFANFISHSSCT